MPCSDSLAWDRSIREEEKAEVKKRLDLATKLLCNSCKEYPIILQNKEVAKWFVKHSKEDAKR